MLSAQICKDNRRRSERRRRLCTRLGWTMWYKWEEATLQLHFQDKLFAIAIICLRDYFPHLQIRKWVEVKYVFKTKELVTSLKLKPNFCLRPALAYA